MNKLLLVLFTITFSLQAQDINAKLGGTTANETYDVTDSGDNLLFRIQGDAGTLFTGTYGTGTIPATGAGTRMVWYPKKAAFRAGNVNSTQWDDINIGGYSVAFGGRTTAKGGYSTAMGYGTVANGTYSTALGYGTTASGETSTAMGHSTTASHNNSTAWGRSTIASGNNSTAMGREIEASGEYTVAIALNDQNGTDVTQANTMAIMGGNVGIGTITPHTNLEVNGDVAIMGGKVGIGTVTPQTDLNVNGEEGLLVQGTYGSGTALNLGQGTRMHFYPKKAAFRAGYVYSTEWDDVNIGAYSTAMGRQTIASGNYSTAMGTGTKASGYASTAMGFATTASEPYSTAMGAGTTASGSYSTALGKGIEASGNYTFAIALTNHIGTNVTQANTMAIMGGKVGINKINPSHLLDVGTSGAYCDGGAWVDGSSRDYKVNIEDLTLEDAITTINQLNPVTYNYKTNLDDISIGFIAEDVPDLVATKDRKGLSAMDFVAILTKVTQQQQATIEELTKRIEYLESM